MCWRMGGGMCSDFGITIYDFGFILLDNSDRVLLLFQSH